MRFLKIAFKNYRCFMDEVVEFKECKNKNLNVLIGPNGSGKTELLFAFKWALYDQNFEAFRGKELTPYALNVDLYRDLESGERTSAKCSIEVVFEHEQKRFILTRTQIFNRTKSGISTRNERTLASLSANGECSVAEKDELVIKRMLEAIMPSSVLRGILFDGERMETLSGTGKESIDAIQGVINDVTSINLLQKIKLLLTDFSHHYSNEIVKIQGRKSNDKTLANLDEGIKQLESRKNDLESKIKEDNDELLLGTERLAALSQKLLDSDKTRDLETSRIRFEEKKAQTEKALDADFQTFTEALGEGGSILIANKIFEDVEKQLSNIEVPKGLVVGAVDSILSQENCICGRPLTDEIREILEQLKARLPPADINASLIEKVRSVRSLKNEGEKRLDDVYFRIEAKEEELIKINDEIAKITVDINALGTEGSDISKIRDERDSLIKKEATLKQNIANNERSLKMLLESLDVKKADFKKRARKSKYLEVFVKYQDFVEKCINALNAIEVENRMTSLTAINGTIKKIFPEIAVEDAEKGRQLCVIQYDKAKCFSMLSYLTSEFNEQKEKLRNSGKYEKYIDEGLTEDEIDEKIKLKLELPSSSGQSTMATLVFVKSILDFSQSRKKQANENEIFVEKTYPLMIDAPFSNIAGENLSAAAKALPSFANQVILMIDPSRYESVKELLEDKISTKYVFERIENENHSKIKKANV